MVVTDNERRRVLVVLPSAMMSRNWLATPLAATIGAMPQLAVTLVTPDATDRVAAEAAGLRWQELARPHAASRFSQFRFALGYLLHLVLAHRFNVIAGFRGQRERLRQSWPLRRVALRDGMPASRLFGWPWPASRSIFRALQRLYHGWISRDPRAERQVGALDPDLVVLGHIQNHFTIPYALAARANVVPVLGLTGSWDQPTTKGPLNPGIGRYLVQGDAIADQLVRFHNVGRENIETVGWVQFDRYATRADVGQRDAQLAALGLPDSARYILLGAYPERLGRHEPALCLRLAQMLRHHSGCVLVVRCHPLDRTWRERFAPLHNPPHIVVLPPELDGLDRLTGQVAHAEVVLSSAGTILLDALALGRPAIALAGEDESEPYFDRVARRYDMEHWAGLVATGGLPLATDDAVLARLIDAVLAGDDADAVTARARLVMHHLAPLDGGTSRRIVNAIMRAAGASSETGPQPHADTAPATLRAG